MAQGIKELAGQVWPPEFHPGNTHIHTSTHAHTSTQADAQHSSTHTYTSACKKGIVLMLKKI